MIKQAIILAAGMGKRLGRYTQDGTKCMVKVNGVSLIERILSALEAAGIQRVVLVVGYRAEKLKIFLDGAFPGLQLIYVSNDIYDKTNNIYSLWLAREYLLSQDTLLLESDLIFEPTLLKELVENPEPNLAVVSKFESWMDGTVTMLDDAENIVSVVDKAHFNWVKIDDYYKTVNIYKFSKTFSSQYYLPFLDAYLSAFGQNEYYEQVLKVLAFLEDSGLKGFKISGRRWYEIDDPHDLAVAETIFSDEDTRLDKMQSRYGGYWRFPDMIDFCYLVNPYFPSPRLYNEMISSFKDVASHYPSGAKIQSQLAAKVFNIANEQAVVGNGAAELIAVLFSELKGNVGLPIPTFGEYSARVESTRLHTYSTDRPDCSYTTEDLLPFSQGVDNLVIINPDNPSGNFLEKDALHDLIDHLLSKGKRIIIDESFVDFAEGSKAFTLLDQDYLSERPGLIVIKSISKSYGIPGFRLGVMASGDIKLMEKIRKAIPIWNINSLGEFFLQIVDKYKGDYKKACASIAFERNRFMGELKKLGFLEVYPSQANYLLCRIKIKLSSRQLTEMLLSKHRIFVKDLANKDGLPEGQYVRIAVRDQKDNDILVNSLRMLLSSGAFD